MPTPSGAHVPRFGGTQLRGALASVPLVLALAVGGACTSGGTTTTPTSGPAAATRPTSTWPASGASSSAQARLVACTTLQAAGTTMSETLTKFVNGQATAAQLEAATESLVAAAQNAVTMAGGAISTQAAQVRVKAQALAVTLRATPPPTTDQVKAAALQVQDALKELQRPCASPSP